MSAELTYQNGVAQMFSVRETPWHHEGRVLAEAPSFEQAMALAGLEYEVKKLPTYVRLVPVGEEQEQYVASQNACVTVRTDTGVELGAVGPQYQVIQNADAFRVIEPLLDKGLAALETGGSLREGADAWLQVRFNLPPASLAGETFARLGVLPFGLLANNHSGRRGVLVQVTPIRVVCANTLGMSESRAGADTSITVRHTESVEARVTEAAEELFGRMVSNFAVAAEQYAALKRTYLDLAEFRRLVVRPLAPDPRQHKKFNPEARLAELVVERYERKVSRLTALWTAGDGHEGDQSAWEAYNAATQSLDHDEDLWPTRGGAYRTASLLDGTIAQRKRRVLDNLLAVASAS